MQLMIINPDYGMTPAQMAERCTKLSACVGPDVNLHMRCLTQSQVYVDSLLDVHLASPEIVCMAIQAEREGFDGVVLYCFSDPALDACREVLQIPVIGGGQASYLAALAISRQFGLIVSDPARIPEKRMFAQQVGVDPWRICSLRAISKDTRETLPLLIEAGRHMVECDGAQALILGCLSWLGMADAVSDALGIPVIDAAMASIAMAEALVRMQLRHSKTSYPMPPAGTRHIAPGCIVISK